MQTVIITGGVGGAKFLLGARQLLGHTPFPQQEEILDYHSQLTASKTRDADNRILENTNTTTAIVNVGDDAWMHGIRIAPDLDSCMYTLGGGIDPERGWGRENETFHAQAELAAYKAEPTWFGLGDKDLATHLLRTHMLHGGYSLSDITAALCARWNPGVRLLPASNDRHETHAIVFPNPHDDQEKCAIHFQQWWVKEHADIPTHSFVQIDSQNSTPAPGVCQAIAQADIIMLAPSNPVVSIGAVLSVPGIRAALRQANAPIIGYSPVIGGAALRGMAEKCLAVEGYGSSAYDIARYYGYRAHGILDGWLIDTADAALVTEIESKLGIPTRSIPLWMHDADHTARMVEAGIEFANILTPHICY